MTDNAMIFTMKYTAHSERITAFDKKAKALGLLHGLIRKGCPWQNGFIERSNRTDNEALFNRTEFSSSEDRRYQLKLWEMYYNRQRPHQGIHMKTPFQRARQQHFYRVSNLALC